MSIHTAAILLVGSLTVLAAALLTGLLRRLALHAGMLDVPNERSSHERPTPRGGGLSICAGVLLAVPVLKFYGILSAPAALALGCGGLLVTIIGWLEDRRGVALPWRALGYLCAATLAVLAVGQVPGGIAGIVTAIVALAWLTNLYNFMDGTDALAGIETVTAATYASLLFFTAGDYGPAWICVVLSATTIGFLYWNWPPARIFMGDAGSCFTGFTFGVLALLGSRSDAVPLLAWFILLGVFICDASLTLLRRVVTGQKWYTPHRSHAYQILVRSGMSHRRLALNVAAINFVILGPLALVGLHYGALPAAAATVLAAGTILWAIIQTGAERTP